MKKLVLIAFLVILVAIGSQSALASQKDNTVVFGQSMPITDLGPAHGAFQKYPAGYEASFALFDRLVTFDPDLNFQPQLAEKWEASADKKSMTFHLRPNVKFHDGTPFNAEAVKFNIERMMNAEINTTNRPLWDPIAGAEVVDEHTVKVLTHKPYALLLNTFAHGSGAMVSPAGLGGDGQKSMNLKPVGAGPFMLESFTPGQILTLKAFDEYWGGRPKVDRLIFKYIPEAPTRISALRTGAVDIIDAVPVHLVPTLKKDPRIQVLTKPGLRPMGLAILTTRPPFDDVRVRQALNHAIPVKTIAEKVFFGLAEASDAPLAFNTVGYKSIGGFDYSPDKAKALLAEAGFKDGNGDGILDKDGRPFTLTLLTSEGTFPNDIQVTEIAARSFQAVGIDATISKVEKGSYWDALRLREDELKWDLALFGFNPSNASGLYHLASLFRSNPDDKDRPAVWNFTRYRNGEVDRLLDEAEVTVDLEQRKKLLGQAQEIIWKEAPYVWMQVNNIVSAAGKDLAGAEVWPIIFTIIRNAHY